MITSRRWLLLAAAMLAAWSSHQAGANAKTARPPAPSKCTVTSGYVDYNRAPQSISDLVEQSDAVVGVRARGKEELALQQSSGGTISFLMRAPVRVDDVVTGDLEPSTTIDLHRVVLGYDLDDALEQARCTVGGRLPLVAGSRYLIGLVQDHEGRWFAASGPYSTIPFATRRDRLVAIADCPVGGSECDQFPYTLAGRSYRAILREARAAA